MDVHKKLMLQVRRGFDHAHHVVPAPEDRSGPLLRRIHAGMEVVSAYGVPIGPITHIWAGQDPQEPGEWCDLERCSRLQVPYRDTLLYIPYSAIAAVEETRVRISVETTQAARGPWRYRPEWLPPLGRTPPLPGERLGL